MAKILGEADKLVLDTIFDPLQSYDANWDSEREPSEASTPEENDEELEESERTSQRQAILLAEQGKLEEALRIFEALLSAHPLSVALRNDRAQALRLAGQHQEALDDLERALVVSGGRGRAGLQALCQRAALRRYLGRDDEAREDFERAAQAGSSFAKSQLVAMNPYAAMCNAMLSKITHDPRASTATP